MAAPLRGLRKDAMNYWSYDTRTQRVVEPSISGPRARGLTLSAMAERHLRRELLDRHGLGDRHAIRLSCAERCRWIRANACRRRSRRAYPIRRQPAQQRYFGDRSCKRTRSQAPGGRPRRELSGAFSRWQSRSTAPTSIQASARSGRRQNRKSRSSIPRARRVVERKPLPNVAGVFHVAISARRAAGNRRQLRPKNLIPLAHVEHGWVFGNSHHVFGADVEGAVQVPLDELDRYYALPFGVAITPDKVEAVCHHDGSDSVTVIDVATAAEVLLVRKRGRLRQRSLGIGELRGRTHSGRTQPTWPGALARRQAPVRREPTATTRSPSSTRANRQSDVNDRPWRARKRSIALRRGERLFYSARFAFQGQFGCANCHLEATFDGLQWDLEPDGFGKDIVDNRCWRISTGTRAFQMEWRQSGSANRVRSAHREILLPLAELQRRGTHRPGDLRQVDPLRPNRYRLGEGRTDAGAGARQGDFRAHDRQERQADSRANQCTSATAGRTTPTRSSSTSAPASRPTARRWSICRSLTNVVLTPRRICMMARREHWKRSGPCSIPTTRTA